MRGLWGRSTSSGNITHALSPLQQLQRRCKTTSTAAAASPEVQILRDTGLDNCLRLLRSDKGLERCTALFGEIVKNRFVKTSDDLVDVVETFSGKGVRVCWADLFAQAGSLLGSELSSFNQLVRIGHALGSVKVGKNRSSFTKLFFARCQEEMYSTDIDTMVRLVPLLLEFPQSAAMLTDVSELLLDEADALTAEQCLSLCKSISSANAQSKSRPTTRSLYGAVSRRLHLLLPLGKLTPWEKALLACAHCKMGFRHLTFFRTICGELLGEADDRLMRAGLDVLETVKPLTREGSMQPDYFLGLGRETDFALPLEKRVVKNRKNTKDVENMLVIPRDMQQVHEERRLTGEQMRREGRLSRRDHRIGSTIEFTLGHAVLIAEILIKLTLDTGLSDVYVALRDNLASSLLHKEEVDKFDPLHLKACMAFLAHEKLVERYDELVRAMTCRVLDFFLEDALAPPHLEQFLRHLVMWRRHKAFAKNRNGRTLHFTVSREVPWLHEKFKDSRYNLMETLAEHMCARASTFSIRDMTGALRALSFLDFTDLEFYKPFLPFLRSKVGSMGKNDIANISQALNRQGVKDAHLFYLMGKRFQQLQSRTINIKCRGKIMRNSRRTGSSLLTASS